MRVEAIFTKHHVGSERYSAKNIIQDILQLHKEDVLTAYSKGIKLMADTLPSDEADLADEYYSENFE